MNYMTVLPPGKFTQTKAFSPPINRPTSLGSGSYEDAPIPASSPTSARATTGFLDSKPGGISLENVLRKNQTP
jgi:hypothetical protein